MEKTRSVLVAELRTRPWNRAEAEKTTAQNAKATVESLINSMLFDLRDKLEPLGRLDLLDDVSNEAQRYFEKNPPSTNEQMRNVAVMWSNRGDVLASASLPPIRTTPSPTRSKCCL